MNPKLIIQPEDRKTQIKDTLALHSKWHDGDRYMPACISERGLHGDAIEQKCPYLSVEELKFLYDIADQINDFHDKRMRETGSRDHHPEIVFRSSPFGGFRPVRDSRQMLFSW